MIPRNAIHKVVDALARQAAVALIGPRQVGMWAIEIKRGVVAKPKRGFHHAREDLQPAKAFVVYSGEDRYPLGDGVEAISLHSLAQELAAL
jgi:hypothetical protein